MSETQRKGKWDEEETAKLRQLVEEYIERRQVGLLHLSPAVRALPVRPWLRVPWRGCRMGCLINAANMFALTSSMMSRGGLMGQELFFG